MYWQTQERLQMAAFTNSIMQDRIHLWVPRPGRTENGLYEDAKRVLEPFEPSLWAFLLGLTFIMGLVNLYVRGPKVALEPLTRAPSRTLPVHVMRWIGMCMCATRVCTLRGRSTATCRLRLRTHGRKLSRSLPRAAPSFRRGAH